MPELPEVEVTRRGILPFVEHEVITGIWHDDLRLREPYPEQLSQLVGARVDRIGRRSKYLLFETQAGTLVIHLGMSGHLRIASSGDSRIRHDHFELMLHSGSIMRFNDQRRFGLVGFLGPGVKPESDRHFAALGKEPFDPDFNAGFLHQALSSKKTRIKQILLSGEIVVGVGNIYASEVLFAAGVHPDRPGQSLTLDECTLLCSAIRRILQESITQGGTTIRDFQGADGKPGYFVRQLQVYGRAGEPCRHCGTAIRMMTIGQRSTYFCPKCQR